jgi:hypothetical protein
VAAAAAADTRLEAPVPEVVEQAVPATNGTQHTARVAVGEEAEARGTSRRSAATAGRAVSTAVEAAVVATCRLERRDKAVLAQTA